MSGSGGGSRVDRDSDCGDSTQWGGEACRWRVGRARAGVGNAPRTFLLPDEETIHRSNVEPEVKELIADKDQRGAPPSSPRANLQTPQHRKLSLQVFPGPHNDRGQGSPKPQSSQLFQPPRLEP